MNVDPIMTDKTSDLLHAYLEIGGGYFEPDAFPVMSYFSALLQCNDLDPIWEVETAYELLHHLLGSLQIEQHEEVTPEVCRRFSEEFIEDLRRNVEEVWLVIPIGQAKCDSLVEFDRFLILPHQIPKEEKLATLADRIPVDKARLVSFAGHTERTISSHFYHSTLVCVRMRHQFQRVYSRSRFVAIWLVAALRALFFAQASFQDGEREKGRVNPWLRIKHLQVIGKRNVRHATVWDSDLTCYFHIGWLRSDDHQRRLSSIFDSLILDEPCDRLAFRFVQSLRFFSKSIETRKNPELFSGLALETLFLMIAAESVLLDREAEKRLRLSYLLPLFGRIPDELSQAKGYEVVQSCYNWRSDFVHSGEDIFPDYDGEFEPGEPQQHLYWLRRMVARLLTLSPDWIGLAESHLQSDATAPTNNRARERAWFGYVNSCWEAAFTHERELPNL